MATSINSFTKYEYKNLVKYFNIKKDFIEAKDEDILKGYKLLSLEGLSCEPSSACIIGSLNKFKEKNICCIISGSIHKDLSQLQNLLT